MSRKIVLLFALLLFYCAASAQTFNMPVFDRTDIYELHIDKVEITKDTTYIYCTYTAEEGSYANISKNTYLEDVITNRKYPILKSSGIPFAPDKKHFVDPTELQVVFCFPAINNTTKFNFIEDRTQKLFNIYGIDLNKFYGVPFTKYQLDRYCNMFEFYMAANDTIKALEYKEDEFRAIEFLYGRKSIPFCYRLVESSHLFADVGDFDKALHYAQKEFLIVTSLYQESDSTYLSSMKYLAQCFYRKEDYPNAISLYKRVAKLYERHFGKTNDYIDILDELALIYDSADSIDKAKSITEHIVEIKNECHQEDAKYYTSLLRLTNYSIITGNTSDAISKILLFLEKYKQQPKLENVNILSKMSNYAEHLFTLDSITIATKIMESVIDMSAKREDVPHDVLLFWQSQLAEYYIKSNDILKALSLDENVVKLSLEIYGEKSEGYSIALENLARCYSKMLDTFSAIELGEKAAKIQKEITGEYSKEYIHRLNNLAAFYTEAKYDSLAIETYERILQIYSVLMDDNNYAYAQTYNNLACLFSKSNVSKAIEFINKAMIICRTNGKDYSLEYAQLLENRGYYYSLLGYYEKAIEDTEKASEIIDAILNSDNPQYALEISYLANYYNKLGNSSKAICYIEKSIDILKKNISLLKSQKESEWISVYWKQLYSCFNDVYPNIVAKTPNSKNISKLCNSLLFSKHWLIGDSYYTDWHKIKESLNDNDIAIEFIFPRALDSELQLGTFYALIIKNNYITPKLVKLFDVFESVNTDVVGELIWRPLFDELNGVENIYFSSVSNLSMTPIEFLPVGEMGCIADKFNVYRLSSTAELVRQKFTKLYKSAVLFGGLYYEKEFEANPIKSLNNNRSGFEYLYNSEKEVNDIVKILEGSGLRCYSYMGEKGTEEVFWQLSGKSVDILHIATHGQYVDSSQSKNELYNKNMRFIQYEENPYPLYDNKALSRSFIVMSGGNLLAKRDSIASIDTNRDGIITALEISNMDLSNVDLVVLSACESALGEIGYDSGILGLQRGLKKAGANTLLMCTENIDDEATSILMTAFYDNLVKGQTKMQAFRNAQRYLCNHNNGQYSNPKYWASFIMLDGLN